jgi:hypothetical protein
MFLGTGVTVPQFLHFLAATTLGNAVGGAVFVAGLNYGHIALVGEEADLDVDVDAEETEGDAEGDAMNVDDDADTGDV